MSWLETHLEEFVKPVVGDIEPADNFFAPEEMTVIKNAWRSIKRAAGDGKTILLPGRDVFVFEVLARRENYPTVFVPECSRMTVKHLVGKIEDAFLFDTGFVGSIPRALKTRNFRLLSSIVRDEKAAVGVQVFPRLTLSRSLALKIEGTPKYWTSGQLINAEVHQDFTGREEFIKAAQLTVEVYKNSAPKFVKRHRPLPLTIGW